jgi:hypothetical protein
MNHYNCADLISAAGEARQGEKIWTGRCAGFYVHSWPNVDMVLEIIDMETRNTMAIVPVPEKPIHFGTIKSVELRIVLKRGLLVSWRNILEAFIEPIYGMVPSGAHGHTQWKPIARNVTVPIEGVEVELTFYAWTDGILRYAFNCSGGNFLVRARSFCEGGLSFELFWGHTLAHGAEGDLVKGRVTAGRLYQLLIKHDDQVNPQNFNLDIGICKDPIDQT